MLVFRVEEWTGEQADICTYILFVWQVSSITVTIEYNILTSSRGVANRLVIIVEDFCCVYCFVRESNSPTDRLFHVVISVMTFIVKMNLCLTEERVHWVCDTRTCTETTFLILRAGMNAFVADTVKG